MKHLLALVIAAAFSVTAVAADAPPKAEKVCIKTTDAKTGKEVEKCKVMKKHEKKEGTTVPDGKKK